MAIINENDKQTNKKATPAGVDEEKRRGSAFNELPPGTQPDNLFGETGSISKPDDEKDVLTGESQKAKPQQDADV